MSELSDAPVGNVCPGCQRPTSLVLPGAIQAFCENDECHVMCWNPQDSLAQMNVEPATMIDLPDWLGGGSTAE